MIISAIQRRFLRLFLSGSERVRVNWLDAEGRVIARVAEPFECPRGAARVQAYRLAGEDDVTFRGDTLNRCAPSVEDVRALKPCWTVPLRELSPLGVELASAAPEPPVVMTFKASPDLDKAVKRRARAEGTTSTAVILAALSQHLAGAENNKDRTP